jgi:hypothetical protein
MRRFAVVLVTLSLLLVGTAAAGTRAGGVPPFPGLGNGWSHAEINVRIAKQLHTLILDRGRIVQVAPDAITLREPDGTITQPISVDGQTIVNGIGRVRTIADLRKRMTVQVMRIDGGAAVRLRVLSVL